MRGNQPLRILCLLLATLASSLAPAQARSVLSSAPSAAEFRSEQIRNLSPYGGRRTLRFQQLTDLLPEVTGRPSRKAFDNVSGNFRRYWQKSKSAFAGKGFEAILAHRENSLRAATGRPNRLLVTAAEGFTADAADLVEVADDGPVRDQLPRFQAKLGAGAAKKALFEAKYAGMTIITTPESLKQIRDDIIRRQANATRRGIALNSYHQQIADALNKGRLTDRMVDGSVAPSRREAERIVRHWLVGEWRTLGSAAGPRIRFVTTAARPMVAIGRLLQSHQVFARGLLVADVGIAAYQTYGDIGRYQTGEISGEYLAFKASLRSVQVGLTYYATLVPTDPATKGLAAMGAGLLVVVDAISDPLYAAWQQRTGVEMLARLEYHERALCVRHSLLRQLQQIGGAAP